MANQNTADRVLELARGELGTQGGDKYIDYYNRITGIGLPHGVAWCAAWVTWVMRQAGVPEDSVLNYKGCTTASAWFQQRGRFRTRQSGYIPKPGDIIMYEWNPQNEGTPYDDGDDHTGLVEYVESGKVHTIEGNNGDQCCRDWWSLENQYISGYCVPLYNVESDETETEDDKMLTYEEWRAYQAKYEDELAKKKESSWARQAVSSAQERGFLKGDVEGDFRSRSYITREELASALCNAFGVDREVSPFAESAWKKAVSAGVLDGTMPGEPLTREQLAVVLDKLGLLEPSAQDTKL